jgi:hypothetical protein
MEWDGQRQVVPLIVRLTHTGYADSQQYVHFLSWCSGASTHILNFMFNHSTKVRPAFYLDPSALRRRFMLCGIAHAVFMPSLILDLHFFATTRVRLEVDQK